MIELDPYVVLGVRASAGQQEVDDAYRALAELYRPDANPGDATAERSFKEVSAAYELLSDPVARARFDRGDVGGSGTADADHVQGAGEGGVDAVLQRRTRYRTPDSDDKPNDPSAGRELEFANPFSGNTIKVLSWSFVLSVLLFAVFAINALEVTGKWHVPGFAGLTHFAEQIMGPRQASVSYSPLRSLLIWIVIGVSAMGGIVAGLMKWAEHRANRPD